MAVKPTVRPAQAAANPTASPPVQPTAGPTPSTKTGQKQAEDTAAWEALQNAPQEVRAQLLQNPEIQNAIALSVAQKLEESGATETQENSAPIDPNALLMADIEQKAAETAAKERIATQKAETDIFRAQLDFEKEKMKIESEEDIAKLKSETELQKQENQNVY
jgi:hypothetical protein